MNREKFITERTKIISEMLDSPDDHGIYPTSKCFEKLDKLYDRIVSEKVTLADVVKLLTKAIKKDPDLRMGYQANIAMAFVDECNGQPGFKDVPYDTLHQAANNAANRFLDNWCG